MRRATERTTAGKAAREGPGKASTVISTWTAVHSLDTSGTLWHEWNHFKPCFCGSTCPCLQLWSFEVPVGLTALEIAVVAEFMKAFAKLVKRVHFNAFTRSENF